MIGRFGLELAPGGLRLVQSLINTALSDTRYEDLLLRPAIANDWARQALAEWAAATGQPEPRVSLHEADLAPLRDIREQLRQLLRAPAAHVESVERAGFDPLEFDIRLTLGADGRVDYAAAESGWRAVAGLAVAELLLAPGTRSRLKTCAAHQCGACFYDKSPNQARAWHDTKMCGNAPNLRASRARRNTERNDG